MIGDFLQFLEFYKDVSDVEPIPYDDPLVRIAYDAINRKGELVLALLAPFSHVINVLCYREIDIEAYYNQRTIARVCRVSPAEVTAWKNESRIPDKYRWFLLLVDISEKSGAVYGHKILHTATQSDSENICNVYLRMVKCCYDPFCEDDVILAEAVRTGCGVDGIKDRLLSINPKYWMKMLKIHEL